MRYSATAVAVFVAAFHPIFCRRIGFLPPSLLPGIHININSRNSDPGPVTQQAVSPRPFPLRFEPWNAFF